VCESILKRVHAEPDANEVGCARSFRCAALWTCKALTPLPAMADELTAEGIRFQAVEPRSSFATVCRNEGLDGKLGGVNRFTSGRGRDRRFSENRDLKTND